MTAYVVFGAGGHARALVDVLSRRGDEVAAFADHTEPASGTRWFADDAEAIDHATSENLATALAVGDNERRADLLRRLLTAGVRVPPIIAATSTVSSTARVGPGTVVFEHAHVGPAASIGSGCVINTSAVVEHDARIGDASHIGPGAVITGDASIGDLVLVGAGAVVLPSVHVGDLVVVGAGAVVRSSVEAGNRIAGVPARAIRSTR